MLPSSNKVSITEPNEPTAEKKRPQQIVFLRPNLKKRRDRFISLTYTVNNSRTRERALNKRKSCKIVEILSPEFL